MSGRPAWPCRLESDIEARCITRSAMSEAVLACRLGRRWPPRTTPSWALQARMQMHKVLQLGPVGLCRLERNIDVCRRLWQRDSNEEQGAGRCVGLRIFFRRVDRPRNGGLGAMSQGCMMSSVSVTTSIDCFDPMQKIHPARKLKGRKGAAVPSMYRVRSGAGAGGGHVSPRS